MRIARLYVEQKPLGSVAIAGKLPRAITWLGEVFVRRKNSAEYQHASTVESSVLFEPNTSSIDDKLAQRVRKMRF